MQHPIRAWGGIALFALTAIDVAAKAAGLYADGPGFLDALLSLGRQVLGSMTAEVVVMLAGLALIAWGPLGDRVNRLRSSTPTPDALASLPEALQNRLATLEGHLQAHERRIAASTQRDDAQHEEAERLSAQVTDFERVATGCLEQMQARLHAAGADAKFTAEMQASAREKALAKVQDAIEATRHGLKSVARVQEARAAEIKVGRLLACVPELPSLADLEDSSGLIKNLAIAEAYIQRVQERSWKWKVLGPSPYEGL